MNNKNPPAYPGRSWGIRSSLSLRTGSTFLPATHSCGSWGDPWSPSVVSYPGTNQGTSLGQATSATGQLVQPFTHQRPGGNKGAGDGVPRSEGGSERGQAGGPLSLEAHVGGQARRPLFLSPRQLICETTSEQLLAQFKPSCGQR